MVIKFQYTRSGMSDWAVEAITNELVFPCQYRISVRISSRILLVPADSSWTIRTVDGSRFWWINLSQDVKNLSITPVGLRREQISTLMVFGSVRRVVRNVKFQVLRTSAVWKGSVRMRVFFQNSFPQISLQLSNQVGVAS